MRSEKLKTNNEKSGYNFTLPCLVSVSHRDVN